MSRIIQFKPYGKVFLEYGFEIWLVLDMKKDEEEGFKWVVWKGNEMKIMQEVRLMHSPDYTNLREGYT